MIALLTILHIVIKKTYTLAWRDATTQALATRVKCLIFLATPQRNAGLASTVRKILRASGRFTYKSSLSDFEKTSVELNKINDEFRHYAGEVRILSFYETIGTNLGIQSVFIVDIDSASMGVKHEHVQPLNADHRTACRFDGIKDPNYIKVKNAIASAVEDILGDTMVRIGDEERAQISALQTYLDVMERPIDELNNEQDNQVAGSCSWIKRLKGFQSWTGVLTPSMPLYWISAPPATGKTVLASHVTKQLQEGGHDCSYYFFKHFQKGRNTLSAMLRSLALQMAILHPMVRKKLLDLQEYSLAFDKEDERVVWRVLFVEAIFKINLERPQYWVIDALDECNDAMKLFPLLLRREYKYDLKILLTSRGPWPDFERQFARLGGDGITDTIPLEGTAHDIRLFFERHMEEIPVGPDEKWRLVEELTSKSAGCFLWARSVWQELRLVHTETQLREVIQELPVEMGLLYERILGEMSRSVRDTRLTKALLVWAVCAVRPLHISELDGFIKIDTDMSVSNLGQAVHRLCGQLLQVDKNGHVQLVHETLRTALTDGSSVSEFAISKEEGNRRLAFVCLKYLCRKEMRSPRSRTVVDIPWSTKSPIAEYACVAFSEHLAMASSSEDALFLELEKFLRSNVLMWVEYITKTKRTLHQLTRAAKNLQRYLNRRAYHVPISSAANQYANQWTTDLMQITAKFGRYLLDNPDSIYHLVPPLCPRDSAIYQTFGIVRSGLSAAGVSNSAWEDSISHIDFQQDSATSVAAGTHEFAIGTSSGRIYLYRQDTYAKETVLHHGEAVSVLCFDKSPRFASASLHMVRLWDLNSETLVWTHNIGEAPILLQFALQDWLVVATNSNRVIELVCDDGATLRDRSFPSKQAPLDVAISPECDLIAFAHSAGAVLLWSLDDDRFLGALGEETSSSAATSDSSPQQILFNPNPAIELVVVTFMNKDMVLYETWSQRVVKTVKQECNYIACSPDGRTLATRSSSGVLGVWDFETLTLIWQTNMRETLGGALSFAACGTCIIQLQRYRATLWKPAVLIRKDDKDDSLEDLSDVEADHGGDEDVVSISATCYHPTRDVILVGKHDGSVSIYSSISGESREILYAHTLHVFVSKITVSDNNIVASQDAKGHVMVYRLKIEPNDHWSTTEELMDITFEEPARQLLLNDVGNRLLISTATADYLFTRDGNSNFHNFQLTKILQPWSRSVWRWMLSTSEPATLVLVVDETIRQFSWDALDELAGTGPHRKVNVGTTSLSGKNLVVKSLGTDITGKNLIAEVGHQLSSRGDDRLAVWQAYTIESQYKETTIDPSFVCSSHEIRHFLGIFEHSIVFLNRHLWVCSIDLLLRDGGAFTEQVKRHFFVPSEFVGTNEGDMGFISRQGDIVFPNAKEVVVVRNGLKSVPYSDILASQGVREHTQTLNEQAEHEVAEKSLYGDTIASEGYREYTQPLTKQAGYEAADESLDGDTLASRDGEEYVQSLTKRTHHEMRDRPLTDHSVASHTNPYHEELVSDFVTRILVEDDDMRTICGKILEKLDRVQFIGIATKKLRGFHLGLVKDAKTDPENVIARLLGDPLNMENICEGIADAITFGRLQEGVAKGNTHEQSHVEDTIRKSKPFHILLNDLRMQLLPQSLKEMMQTASYASVSLSEQNNNSLINRFKAFVEDFTRLEWNWWPLEPRIRNMSPNETRLFWRCVS
jgi:WD40 repeat protein